MVSSSKVSLDSPTQHLRCFLVLLTAASHKPPKWGPYKAPLHIPGRAEIGEDSLRLIPLQELVQLLQFTFGSHKAGAMIAQDENQESTTSSGLMLGCQERFQCQLRHEFNVNCLHRQDTKMQAYDLAIVGSESSGLDEKRTSIIHSHTQE